MNSAELPVRFRTSTESSPWENVRRIYRRICLLRARGREDEAAALEHGELAGALGAARIAADGEVDEAALLTQESERVASATVLAELVAPLLVERLQSEVASLALRAPSPAAAASAAKVPEQPPPARPAGSEAVPAIADLIDGMLSQQSKAPPSRRSR